MYDVARPPDESKALERDCDVLERWNGAVPSFSFTLFG